MDEIISRRQTFNAGFRLTPHLSSTKITTDARRRNSAWFFGALTSRSTSCRVPPYVAVPHSMPRYRHPVCRVTSSPVDLEYETTHLPCRQYKARRRTHKNTTHGCCTETIMNILLGRFLARDAFVKTNRHAIAMMFVRLSVCDGRALWSYGAR